MSPGANRCSAERKKGSPTAISELLNSTGRRKRKGSYPAGRSDSLRRGRPTLATINRVRGSQARHRGADGGGGGKKKETPRKLRKKEEHSALAFSEKRRESPG